MSDLYDDLTKARSTYRLPPDKLKFTYEVLKEKTSDINEHLETLFKYASQCEHVTEIGMRGAVSTTALLAAQPKTLISWDINPWAILSPNVQSLLMLSGRTSFQPRVGNSLECEIEDTDMLFIDSLHTYEQLKKEFTRHARAVRTFMVLHDTITFGRTGEDGTTPGLRQAIHDLQRDSNIGWTVLEDRENNNGLTVLGRISQFRPRR